MPGSPAFFAALRRIALPAAHVGARRRHARRADRAHAAGPMAEPRADLDRRQARAQAGRRSAWRRIRRLRQRQGWRGLTDLRGHFGRRRFDALLHMQVALRANLLSALVRAPCASATTRRDRRICTACSSTVASPSRTGEHVLDAMASFLEPLGLRQTPRAMGSAGPRQRGGIRRTKPARRRKTLLVSPCSSHRVRNWRPERYAAVIDCAAQARLACRAVRRPERLRARIRRRHCAKMQ